MSPRLWHRLSNNFLLADKQTKITYRLLPHSASSVCAARASLSKVGRRSGKWKSVRVHRRLLLFKLVSDCMRSIGCEQPERHKLPQLSTRAKYRRYIGIRSRVSVEPLSIVVDLHPQDFAAQRDLPVPLPRVLLSAQTQTSISSILAAGAPMLSSTFHDTAPQECYCDYPITSTTPSPSQGSRSVWGTRSSAMTSSSSTPTLPR